ncbi:GNAT family N-acetyltransferase [Paenibacillus mendelii]|uniref:GNAT family N-acetyltransferase n=1 Tax=Paenibacillus mendelii TaxID=206163 RepID=A0ABV6J9C7_9BACL|nr:GNAT family N-acetyltransferase [Paenibacillus mendelii]MCQ6559749.1 GNAT family N-acetyltransferase [Paenibacillus mendelii]
MPDMLVKLYELPEDESAAKYAERTGVMVRRAIGPELRTIGKWVEAHFGQGWRSECEVAISRQPVSCFIAVKDGQLLGFACYDATCKGFFGPTGVDEQARGLGIGKRLFLETLRAMREDGYGYAVIGGAGPTEFYAKTAGATVIEGSVPGIYAGMLKVNE